MRRASLPFVRWPAGQRSKVLPNPNMRPILSCFAGPDDLAHCGVVSETDPRKSLDIQNQTHFFHRQCRLNVLNCFHQSILHQIPWFTVFETRIFGLKHDKKTLCLNCLTEFPSNPNRCRQLFSDGRSKMFFFIISNTGKGERSRAQVEELRHLATEMDSLKAIFRSSLVKRI